MATEKVTFPSFFGKIDRRREDETGDVMNAIPAWYFNQHINELNESIAMRERQIKMGGLNAEQIAMHKAAIEQERHKLAMIKESRLKLTGKQTDALADFYKFASGVIADTYPTYTAMMKGLADPHDELRKMKTPFIGISKYNELMKAMNIKPVQGKINRDQLVLAWKMAGKHLGEVTNAEYLRRDRRDGTYQSERSLAEMDATHRI